MKTFNFIFILSLLGYVLTDTFDCETEFKNLLKENCENIDSCSYNPNDPSNPCVEIHECNSEASSICSQINPPNYLSHKCSESSGVCTAGQRQCSDYIANGIIGNSCTSLSAPYPNDQRCILIYGSTSGTESCQANYKDCTKITSTNPNVCNNNIPELLKKRCSYTAGATPSCNPVDRECNNGDKSFVNFFGKDKCDQLALTGTNDEKSKKKCIYNGEKCQEVIIKCQDLIVSSGSQCEAYTPLQDNVDAYNYSQICTHDTSITTETKCKVRNRKCTEYNLIPGELLNEEMCGKLETSETYYRCAYNEEDNECYEEYDTCEAYITNKVETQRSNCEGIALKDKTKTCVYNQKEDKCVTREIYSNCTAYKGKDKKICESILSSESGQYCILEKDSMCIEKPINCTEAHTDKEMCLKIAKASDTNKRCAFYTATSPSTRICYEEYTRCEDYLGTSSLECESIILYDGKKCKWESSSVSTGTNINRCRSTFKICTDSKTKEECKLIAQTGVSNPEMMVCDWIGGSCKENYKYCSDYRGTSTTTCSNIKPYDESGENLDIGFKCAIDETSVGCEKVPVECEDAGNSRSLCETYSQYIKDNDKKFCVFDRPGDTNNECCHSHYKKCENIKHSSELSSCAGNIIEGYIEGACVLEDSKCVTKNICSKLGSTYISKRDFFTRRINANCSYTSSSFKYKEKSCSDVTFYSNNTNNKEICENMQASKPYQKCVLKEDQTGCDEVYKEFDYSTAGISFSPSNTSSQGNSSGFIKKGIFLAMSLLCLLI